MKINSSMQFQNLKFTEKVLLYSQTLFEKNSLAKKTQMQLVVHFSLLWKVNFGQAQQNKQSPSLCMSPYQLYRNLHRVVNMYIFSKKLRMQQTRIKESYMLQHLLLLWYANMTKGFQNRLKGF